MLDFRNFKKYRIIYLFVILLLALLFAVWIDPLYREVFVDIRVEPPEKIRKTDFSWLTVGEWFNTQARLMTSYLILKDVKSDISEDKLRQIVSAKRIGASDVIRLSVRSRSDLTELENVINNIANLYLEQADNPKNGYIITPPTQKIFPELIARLLIASVIGFILWILTGYLLKNAYLFWILKDRLFKKR